MNFVELIRSSRPYLEVFDYDHYPRCFAAFEEKAVPLLKQLTDGRPEETACTLLDSLEKERGEDSKREQREALNQDRQVLALFFTPAAGKCGEKEAAFAEVLCSLWNRRYPRNPYYIGTYENIMKGFDANLLGLPLRKSGQRGKTL
ncbi:MAG: hypothetical protein K6C08_12825 [Oscillospiraceae bacterium]|nr:hypothetical protein [Oscillospiraceae bacterium]